MTCYFSMKASNQLFCTKNVFTTKIQTSNGTFTTTKVSCLDVTFPEFSSTKLDSFKADIASVSKNDKPPIYDLIIGIKSFAKMGAILDFAKQNLTVDLVTLPMRPHNQFMKSNVLQVQF